MVRCVCASMKPGSSVASPKSITSAPAGVSALFPTDRILPSETTTTPGLTSVLLFPSKSRAAFSTYALPAARSCAIPLHGRSTTIPMQTKPIAQRFIPISPNERRPPHYSRSFPVADRRQTISARQEMSRAKRRWAAGQENAVAHALPNLLQYPCVSVGPSALLQDSRTKPASFGFPVLEEIACPLPQDWNPLSRSPL